MPPESFRGPLLRIIVSAVFDDFAEDKLRDELAKMLEQYGHNAESVVLHPTRLPLDQDIRGLPFWGEIGVRCQNCVLSDGIVTLGELLVLTEAEWLRVPNFGRKSFNELNGALQDQFGVSVGQIPENQKQRYEGTAHARKLLNQAAGQLLPSHWDSTELKPEYKDLLAHERESKARKGEEIYLQINADPELLEALRQAGIVYKTQLATAPQRVIDEICEGHDNWRELLIKMLGGRYDSLKLNTPTPLYLRENVTVYKP